MRTANTVNTKKKGERRRLTTGELRRRRNAQVRGLSSWKEEQRRKKAERKEGNSGGFSPTLLFPPANWASNTVSGMNASNSTASQPAWPAPSADAENGANPTVTPKLRLWNREAGYCPETDEGSNMRV